jgi:hypothetical protein
MPVIPALGRWRQEDHEASLDGTVRPCLKNKMSVEILAIESKNTEKGFYTMIVLVSFLLL